MKTPEEQNWDEGREGRGLTLSPMARPPPFVSPDGQKWGQAGMALSWSQTVIIARVKVTHVAYIPALCEWDDHCPQKLDHRFRWEKGFHSPAGGGSM
jgi:hypothetical protein